MKPVLWLFFLASLLLGSCRTRPAAEPKEGIWSAENSLRPVGGQSLSHDGPADALRKAMSVSLDYYRSLPGETLFVFGPERVRADGLAAFLESLISRMDEWGLGGKFFDGLAESARFYESAAQDVLVTGYFEIRLRGSLHPSSEFAFPVYRKPSDLVRISLRQFLRTEYDPPLPDVLRARLTPRQEIVPYYSRHEIDRQGLLRDRGLELCWIDDPFRLFFLHIQGSGVVELEDGSELRLNYAESNGHAYRSIGRTIVDRFDVDMDTLSMQGIYDFLVQNPQQADEVLDSNPSYVFFRMVPEGPIGSLGRVVTPLCSVATDARLFPKGALGFLESELPEFDGQGRIKGWKKVHMLVLNQDTGGAIRGPGRVDWFIGSDRESEQIAGYLKRFGRLIFLAPGKRH